MVFEQKVLIKNIIPLDVIKSFHDHRFIEFLTFAQPVKIKNWSGIDNGKKAIFSFWFFGWRKFSVIHKNYEVGDNFLYFGLQEWEHCHIVKGHQYGTMIIDRVHLHENNRIKRYLISLIMLLPIVMRRLTYRIWFYFLKEK